MAGIYFTPAELDHLCQLVARQVDHTQAQQIHSWAERASFSEILGKLRKAKAEAAWERERAARTPVEAGSRSSLKPLSAR